MINNRFVLKQEDENGDVWIYEGEVMGHPIWTEEANSHPLYLNEIEAQDIARMNEGKVYIVQVF